MYGRQIGNNIHLLRDLIDLVNKNNEEACFLFLDQEKAFDRVNHSFLFKVLQQFGFGESFIQWIRVLYANASTNVLINGFLTENIALKSGVRQGCPLSPYLFLLVMTVMFEDIHNNTRRQTLHGKIDGLSFTEILYADDTLLVLKNTRATNILFKEIEKRISVLQHET